MAHRGRPTLDITFVAAGAGDSGECVALAAAPLRLRPPLHPTDGSWVNLCEPWLSALRRKKLPHSVHRNVKELAADSLAPADDSKDNLDRSCGPTTRQIFERHSGHCAPIDSVA
jgi:hypothetical protein